MALSFELPREKVLATVPVVVLCLLILFPASVYITSRFVLFSVVILFGILGMLLRREEVWPDDRSGIALLLWAMLLWISLSLFTTVSLGRTLDGLALWIIFALVFAQGGEAELSAKKIVYLLVAVAVLHCLYSVYQKFWSFPELEALWREKKLSLDDAYLPRIRSGRVFSTFMLPSHLAGFLAAVLPCFLLLIRESRKKATRLLSLAGLLLVLYVLFLTKSYGGWVALGGAALLYFVSFGRVRKLYLAGILLAVIFLLFSVYLSRGTSPFDFGSIDSSFAARARNVSAALGAIKESPVVGFGYGTFGLIYPRTMQKGDNETHYVHNSYLQFAAELGIGGGVLLAGMALLYNLYYFSRKRTSERSRVAVADVFFIGANVSWIHNLFDFSIYLPEMGALGFLLAGLSLRFPERPNEARPALRPLFLPVGRVCLIVLLAGAFVYSYASFRSAQFLAKAREQEAGSREDVALASAYHACAWNPWSEKAMDLAFALLERENRFSESTLVLQELGAAEPSLAWVQYFLGRRMAVLGDWGKLTTG